MKIRLNCIEKHNEMPHTKIKLTSLVSWNYMHVVIVTFITYVTVVIVKISNYTKVTYFDNIYAPFLGRRWSCILWVS